MQTASDGDANSGLTRSRGLSRPQLLAICIAQINEAIQVTMPYTLAVYMVRDFQSKGGQQVANEEAVGRLTGLLAACFCAAQFLSSFPWGRASDRFGRKPMVVMSNLSSCLSVIAFGLSTSFAQAAFFRLLGGFFNCTFVCLKSMIGESCSIKQQARPLSYLSLCWGLGTVVGPSLGGVLSQPCKEFGAGFPLCHENGLFLKSYVTSIAENWLCNPEPYVGRLASPNSYRDMLKFAITIVRPFLLPCLAVGSISFIAFVSSIFFMQETLPKLVAAKYSALEEEGLDERPLDTRSSEMELSSRPSYASAGKGGRDLEANQPGRHSTLESATSLNSIHEDTEQSALLVASENLPSRSLKIAVGQSRQIDSETPADLTPREGLGGAAVKLLDAQLSNPRDSSEVAVWYKDKETLLTITGYVFICLLYNLLDEVTPIYSSADRSVGGLGLSTSQLAVPLSIGGISIFLWSMFFYPAYQEYFGVLNACRLGIIGTIPLCLGLAFPSLLNIGVVGLQAILATVLFFKNIMATNSFTSAVMMVNAAAPQKAIGAVNGAAQAAASFVRAVGPALGGLMWAFSVSISIPGHQMLAFGLTAAGFFVPLLIYSFLKLPNLT